jgi:4-amino-4-deoxy-L-arabinose transferase-like glycosyltransferase
LLIALSALPFLFLMPLFAAPFERDQGTYATIARGWMDGAVPYRDLWDNKGPLLFLWYVASFAWMGETTLAPRVMASAAAGLSVPFVWATANTLFGRRVAALAATLFAFSFANIYLQVNANAEAFMLLPMSAGLWAFARGVCRGEAGWFVAAGVLTSLAVFTRQSAVWAFVGYGAMLAVIFWRHPGERSRQLLAGFLTATGSVLAAIPFLVYFGANDALYELWHAMFGFNLGWAAEQSIWLKLVPPLFVEPGPLIGGLVFWLLAGIGVWRLWKRNDRAAWLVLSSLAAAEAAAQTMGKGSAHYSIQLLPGAAIAAAFGVQYVAERSHERARGLKAAVAVSAAITLGALVFAYSRPTAGDRLTVQYTYRDYADDAIAATAVADAVAAMSEPGDCVYEWGRSSQIYFLSDRQPCTRWFHNRPYEVDPSVLVEVMADLEENRPAVVLVTSKDRPVPPELQAFIDERYRYVRQVEYAALYERVGG